MMNYFTHNQFAQRAGVLASIVLSIVFFVSVPQSAHAKISASDAKLGANSDGTPRIANWYFKYSIDSDEEARELAERDVILLELNNESTSRNKLELIKEINPDIILLAYVSMADIRPDASELPEGTYRRYIGEALDENPGWIMKKANGDNAEWWPTYRIFNVTNKAPKNSTGKRFNDYYPRFLRDAVIKDPLWDGIFFDNVWEGVSFVSADIDTNSDGKKESVAKMNKQWRKGVQKILKKTRKYAKKNHKDFIITGNGGVGYYKYLNGVAFEHFPNRTAYGSWTGTMKQYDFILKNARENPEKVVVTNTNVNNTGKRTNYKKFRFGLTSSLLGNGIHSHDNGDQSHSEIWHYDEYDAFLGNPIGGAYNMLKPDDPTTKRRGVWRRDYKDAIVLVNSTKKKQTINLRTGFEKIQGEQDPKVNSGDVSASVTLKKRDGIILLRRLTALQDATFVNGAFASVYNAKGTRVRKSFFSFDGSFPGNVQAHRIADTGQTVVADQTWVRVYDDSNNQIAAFAPYGTDFSGGINIDVGRLYGKKKNYIVTGTQSGSPQVRIFDLRGKVKHPGCFPFDKDFDGGVSVAVGNLNRDKRMEIVVAPHGGGGPQVRILNNYCELINPGFQVFPEEVQSGVSLSVGDVTGDTRDEIVVVPRRGNSHVRVFNRKGKLLSPGFLTSQQSNREQFVSVANVTGKKKEEIVTYSFSIFDF